MYISIFLYKKIVANEEGLVVYVYLSLSKGLFYFYRTEKKKERQPNKKKGKNIPLRKGLSFFSVQHTYEVF